MSGVVYSDIFCALEWVFLSYFGTDGAWSFLLVGLGNTGVVPSIDGNCWVITLFHCGNGNLP